MLAQNKKNMLNRISNLNENMPKFFPLSQFCEFFLKNLDITCFYPLTVVSMNRNWFRSSKKFTYKFTYLKFLLPKYHVYWLIEFPKLKDLMYTLRYVEKVK